VCPTWKTLLLTLSDGVEGVRDHVRALLATDAPSSRDYEVAAQMIEDALADRALGEAVRKAFAKARAEREEGRAIVERRKDLLLDIPFANVLTTNFDDVLEGDVLGAGTYEGLLRGDSVRWWDARFRRGRTRRRVLKLHGDLGGDGEITLSRQAYRKRLHADPGYLHALRSVFMTRSVLFLGFSFTDEYLNELRSEVLSYLARPDGTTPTLAYAVLADVTPAMREHYRRHEGIEVFDYGSRAERGHGAFDDFLERLHALTTPSAILGARLEGRAILWVDPHEDHGIGWRFLEEAAKGRCVLESARSPEEALARIAETESGYDLVITRWNHRPGGSSDGMRLLDGMRARGLTAPVVVFASGDHAEENREEALRRGALEYTFHWDTLCEVIDRRFGPPPGASRPRRGKKTTLGGVR
jgi:CheY-like chemotaxis protein